MTWSGYPIAFLAGALTTLSPCVLPILPLIMGAALNKNRLAPLFMCIGLSFAFVIIGWSVAAFGSLLGVRTDTLRLVGGALLGIFGLFFLIQKFSDLLSNWLLPLSNYASQKLAGMDYANPFGSLLIGVLLGAVWSPCSGPTLGLAVSLATQAGTGTKSFVLMSFFSIGAVMPLLMFSYGARNLVSRYRTSIFHGVGIAKKIIGGLMVLVSVAILTGIDKNLEAAILNILPDFWIDLTVRY